MNATHSPATLISRLAYEPRELTFGTSGRRGAVVHLTQLEIYINALAELQFLQTLSANEGGIRQGDEFFLAHDLRPSSIRYVEDQGGRGEIAQAVERAVRDAGMIPVNLGKIPTPALTAYALSRGKGSIMITGSHIPFDRNGYKTNTSRGELLKRHEQPIDEQVREVRQVLYAQDFSDSLFDENGRFKAGHVDLAPENDAGRAAYTQRYADFFGEHSLDGVRVLVYQHSAVGRDLLPEILNVLGAEAIPAGRSDTFVPIDTENMVDEQLALIQALHEEAAARHGRFDAIVSTDGDSDRPLILGVDSGRVSFLGGDLVGMVTAQYLGADAVVVPISCNDAIDLGALKDITERKTKIGSPFVIAGMEQAIARGKRAVCGFEANGGFLTGSSIVRKARTLPALPTRDAVLPILSVLSAAREKGLTLTQLFGLLPRRYSRAALIKNFPRRVSLDMIERFSPADGLTLDALFDAGATVLLDEDGNRFPGQEPGGKRLRQIRHELAALFPQELGFGEVVRLNFVDGVRIYFSNGDVAHLRPSGNADELRIYAIADSQQRADAIAKMAVVEPNGILRRMERMVPG